MARLARENNGELVLYRIREDASPDAFLKHARVITEDADLSRARLLLVENLQKTVRRGLEILGIDAPTKMAARVEAGQ